MAPHQVDELKQEYAKQVVPPTTQLLSHHPHS